MKHIKSVLVFSLLILSINCFSEVNNLSSDELLTAQQEGAIIIDIRTPEEWQELGTIPGAHKIMFFDQSRKPQVNEFLTKFNSLVTSKDQAIVLVCKSGNRTGVASKFLNENLGYTHVSHLEKGMMDWIAKNHQVEKEK